MLDYASLSFSQQTSFPGSAVLFKYFTVNQYSIVLLCTSIVLSIGTNILRQNAGLTRQKNLPGSTLLAYYLPYVTNNSRCGHDSAKVDVERPMKTLKQSFWSIFWMKNNSKKSLWHVILKVDDFLCICLVYYLYWLETFVQIMWYFWRKKGKIKWPRRYK